jgi:hypothetical protein
MAQYEIRFFNHGDLAIGTDHFRAEGDDLAICFAARLLRNPFGRAHEFWDGERLVHREMYPR